VIEDYFHLADVIGFAATELLRQVWPDKRTPLNPLRMSPRRFWRNGGGAWRSGSLIVCLTGTAASPPMPRRR
jgi:hypothetical protein